MYQTIEAIWKNGQVVPLEPLTVEEDTPLIVTALKSDTLHPTPIDAERAAKIRALKGSLRGWTSGVDGFIARKQEDIELEERL